MKSSIGRGDQPRYAVSLCFSLLLLALAACERTSALQADGPVPEGFVRLGGKSISFGSSEEERSAALIHVFPSQKEETKARMGLEFEPFEAQIPLFLASVLPVSNREYANFVQDTGYAMPSLSKDEWQAYGSAQTLGLNAEGDYERFVAPCVWRDGKAPIGREAYPVTLVSRTDALAYCDWLSKKLGRLATLPDELQSALCGGEEAYPWGSAWRAQASGGEGDSLGAEVKAIKESAGLDVSAEGVQGYAGLIYEWTRTPWPKRRNWSVLRGGGAWTDGPADRRRACRRIVPDVLKHPLVGFRVILEE